MDINLWDMLYSATLNDWKIFSDIRPNFKNFMLSHKILASNTSCFLRTKEEMPEGEFEKDEEDGKRHDRSTGLHQ